VQDGVDAYLNTGNLLEAYEYNGQGQFQVSNSSGSTVIGSQIANFLMFAGQYYDPEIDSYYCHARYYSATLGRFLSRDPLSPGFEFICLLQEWFHKCDRSIGDDVSGRSGKLVKQSRIRRR